LHPHRSSAPHGRFFAFSLDQHDYENEAGQYGCRSRSGEDERTSAFSASVRRENIRVWRIVRQMSSKFGHLIASVLPFKELRRVTVYVHVSSFEVGGLFSIQIMPPAASSGR
jgi:hypothetical protein